MIRSWQLAWKGSIIARLPLSNPVLGPEAGSPGILDWSLQAALLAGGAWCARRLMPREYVLAISLIAGAAGGAWWWLARHWIGRAGSWEAGFASGLGWAGAALCSRLAARRLWFVPGSAVQPGLPILVTAGVLAAIAGSLSMGVVWRSSSSPILVLMLFAAAQLALQIGLTPWFIDKRRLVPAADGRPVWVLGAYLVAEIIINR